MAKKTFGFVALCYQGLAHHQFIVKTSCPRQESVSAQTLHFWEAQENQTSVHIKQQQ